MAARAAAAVEGSQPFHMLMQLYYGRLFPSKLLYRWLAYGHDGKASACDASFFKRREFCFTLDGDIFVRYRSFQDAKELAAALRDRVPSKIDLGPVYTQDPSKRAAYKSDTAARGFAPVQRELVFDIDLTDYDDVRTTSSGAAMSARCWVLMHAAIQVLDRGLREDFGFEHILWVYSGRRGIHCWVCDERARLLSDTQRGAIANYFAVYKGQEKGLPRLGLTQTNHPSVERAYGILQQLWPQILLEQELLTNDRTRALMLRFLPDPAAAAELERKWARGAADAGTDANVERWQDLEAKVRERRKETAWRRVLPNIVFAFAYPRLDIEVSKKMNHLLKAPFCVHPKTGKVCVPIDPSQSEAFDPEGVPTLSGLIANLNERRKVEGQDDVDRTDLAPYLRYFERRFLGPLEADARAALLAEARGEAAHSLEW